MIPTWLVWKIRNHWMILDLESLEKELELLSGDLEEEIDEQPDADELNLSDEVAVKGKEAVLDPDSTDEITTKLDLARAYVDMGDEDGAKSILEEVVIEGSDTQKQQAQELLVHYPAHLTKPDRKRCALVRAPFVL